MITRYVLENPWPLAILLAAAGAVIAWQGLREGIASRQRTGLGLGTAAVAVIMVGWFITTPGEHAAGVVRSLVDAVVADDTATAARQFAPEAVLTLGSPSNPGFSMESIQERLDRLAERYNIESNRIHGMTITTASSAVGEAEFSCVTTVAAFPYPTSSRWLVRVENDGSGTWRITRITCEAINNQTPSSAELW